MAYILYAPYLPTARIGKMPFLPLPPPFPPFLAHFLRNRGIEPEAIANITTKHDLAALGVNLWISLRNGQELRLFLSDEFLYNMGVPTDVLLPPFPTVTVPYPVIGWRVWAPYHTKDKKSTSRGMYGTYGTRWETPTLEATCHFMSSPPPHEYERCGIYLTKAPYFGVSTFGYQYTGLVVATRLIEHEHGYRAGLVRCIAIDKQPFNSPGWDGISVMSQADLVAYSNYLNDYPEEIPYPLESAFTP